MCCRRVLILSLLLCGWTLAQQESEIRVDIDSAPHRNNRLMLTVPRVSKVVFESDNALVTTSQGDEQCERDGTIPEDTCVIRLHSGLDSYHFVLETPLGVTGEAERIFIKVLLAVNDDYQVGCGMHVFPVNLNVDSRFDCKPVSVNTTLNITSTVWWRADNSDGINATAVDPEDPRIVIGAESLSFPEAGTQDAGYYFPVVDGLNVSQTAPVLVSYQPRITSTESREFSRDFYIDPNVPQNTTFFCVVESFTRPTMIWRYTSAPGGENETVACPECTLNDNITNVIARRVNVGNRVNFTLEIVDVKYDNSGIYTCVPETEAFKVELNNSNRVNAHSFRLRVKDHLRPLWPAIGTIAVFLSMIVIISCGALWDHFYTKPRRERERQTHGGSHRPFSVTSTSSGSPDGDVPGIRMTEGHAALRRLSSARVQLLEEPEN